MRKQRLDHLLLREAIRCLDRKVDALFSASWRVGAAFGGKIVRAQQLMHGKTSVISTTQQGVFAGLPAQFTVNRYHSLAIERSSCPAELELTAWTEDGEIMGVRHRSLPIQGLQFHPESILTEHGHAMLKNFLQ